MRGKASVYNLRLGKHSGCPKWLPPPPGYPPEILPQWGLHQMKVAVDTGCASTGQVLLWTRVAPATDGNCIGQTFALDQTRVPVDKVQGRIRWGSHLMKSLQGSLLKVFSQGIQQEVTSEVAQRLPQLVSANPFPL